MNPNATNLSAVSGGSSLRDLNTRILEACRSTDINKDILVDNVSRFIQRDDSGSLPSFESSFSVDNPSSLAAVLQPNPEEVLLNLGFGGSGETTLLHTVPSRFLQQPSALPGIDVDAFQKSIILPEVNQASDCASSILRRFSTDSISDSCSIHSTPADFRRILFKSSRVDIPSIHLSYDADCISSPGASSVENTSSVDGTQRTRLSTLAELPEPISRRSSFEEEVALAFDNTDVIGTACKILESEGAAKSTPQDIGAMYSNVLVPCIKRSDSEKSCNSNVTVVPNPMSDPPILMKGSTITESLFKPIDPEETTTNLPSDGISMEAPITTSASSKRSIFQSSITLAVSSMDGADTHVQERTEGSKPDIGLLEESSVNDVERKLSHLTGENTNKNTNADMSSNVDNVWKLNEMEADRALDSVESGIVEKIVWNIGGCAGDYVDDRVTNFDDSMTFEVNGLGTDVDVDCDSSRKDKGVCDENLLSDVNGDVDGDDIDIVEETCLEKCTTDNDSIAEVDDEMCPETTDLCTTEKVEVGNRIDDLFGGSNTPADTDGNAYTLDAETTSDDSHPQKQQHQQQQQQHQHQQQQQQQQQQHRVCSYSTDSSLVQASDLDDFAAAAGKEINVSNDEDIVCENNDNNSEHDVEGTPDFNHRENDFDNLESVPVRYKLNSAETIYSSSPSVPSVDDGIGLSHSLEELEGHVDDELKNEVEGSKYFDNMATIGKHPFSRTYSVSRSDSAQSDPEDDKEGDDSHSPDEGNDTQKIIQEIREILSRPNSTVAVPPVHKENKHTDSDDDLHMINDLRNILLTSRYSNNDATTTSKSYNDTQPSDKHTELSNDFSITNQMMRNMNSELDNGELMKGALPCSSDVSSTQSVRVDNTIPSDESEDAALVLPDDEQYVDESDGILDDISEIVVVNETDLQCIPPSDADTQLGLETVSDNDNDLALNDALRDFFFKLKQDSSKEPTPTFSDGDGKGDSDEVINDSTTPITADSDQPEIETPMETRFNRDNKKSAKNYFAAAFHSLALALGKYQDAKPSNSSDEICNKSKNESGNKEDDTVKHKNDKSKSEKQKQPKRNFFSLFHNKPYDMGTDEFATVAANIVEGKVELDPVEHQVEEPTVKDELFEPVPEGQSNLEECKETQTQYCCNCRTNQANTSSRSSTEKTPCLPMQASGYIPDYPVSSDREECSSVRIKRKRYVPKSLKKGASIESSGFDEGFSKHRCLYTKNKTRSPNTPPSPPDVLPITRKIEELMNNARSCLEHDDGGGKGADDGTDYFSHHHFEYVIQQLTRIRTEINTHFDEQAKRENELKVLLNNQVNEMRHIITSEYMHRMSRDLDVLKHRLEEKDEEIQYLRQKLQNVGDK